MKNCNVIEYERYGGDIALQLKSVIKRIMEDKNHELLEEIVKGLTYLELLDIISSALLKFK